MKNIYIYIYIHIVIGPSVPKLGFRVDLARGSAPPFKTTIPKRESMGPKKFILFLFGFFINHSPTPVFKLVGGCKGK